MSKDDDAPAAPRRTAPPASRRTAPPAPPASRRTELHPGRVQKKKKEKKKKKKEQASSRAGKASNNENKKTTAKVDKNITASNGKQPATASAETATTLKTPVPAKPGKKTTTGGKRVLAQIQEEEEGEEEKKGSPARKRTKTVSESPLSSFDLQELSADLDEIESE